MKKRCAWCRQDQGEVPPYEDTRYTDGICPACLEIHFPKKSAAK